MTSTPIKSEGKAGASNGISPFPDPPIRTLKVELLSHNSTKFVPLIPNAREPTPFETEFFKGIAMIVIRTAPIDKNFECYFVGRRRLFEVQVQGKFKREPAGEIFVGAESSCKMELGLFTRSISLAAMKLCSTMVTDMHYSFGDSLDNPNHQLPHVVGPIFPTMDKIIVTPPGETPPALGIPFTEDINYRKERLKFKSIDDAQVKLDHTYSLSVNTSNLNLLDWTMVNIPMVKPMDLRTFFGNASIQLVGYEMPRAISAKFPNAHPNKLMNYVFNMRLTPVEPDALPIVDLPTLDSEDEEEDATAGKAGAEESVDIDHLVSPPPEQVDAASETEEEDEDIQPDGKIAKNLDESFAKEKGGDMMFSGRTMSTGGTNMGSGLNGLPRQKVERTTVGGWLRKKFARINNRNSSSSSGTTMGSGATRKGTASAFEDMDDGDVNESTAEDSMDWENENVVDLSFCPGCIELNDSKRDGRGKFAYFLALHPSLDLASQSQFHTAAGEYHVTAPRLKSYSEIAKVLPLVPLPKLPKNRRLSPLEKRRRQIVESYRQVLKDPTSPSFKRFQAAMAPVTDSERSFLQNASNFVNERRNTRDGLISWECAVALVLSRRHYLEQSMVLTLTDLVFRRSSESKRNQIHIPLEQILSVQPVSLEQSPMNEFAFLQIETFARVYTVMLYSDTLVNEWIPLFSRAMNRDCMLSPHRLPVDSMMLHGASAGATTAAATAGEDTAAAGSSIRPTGHSRSATMTNDSITDREEFYLARPACWKLDKRRVFNYRRVHFKPTHGGSSSSSSSGGGGGGGAAITMPSGSVQVQHPCNLVASLLAAAFYLSHVLRTEQSRVSDSDWIRFWDELSLLQTISLINLTEPEKTTFFLNLYHVMILHGSMVFGPPPAWNHWNGFFNQITYIVAGELVSIAEIEYCILKANMSRSYMFTAVAMPAPPSSTFPHLESHSRDFRLHFAINCGSLSNMEEVPVYTPELLDMQLDQVMRMALDTALEIDVSRKTVTMPRLPMIDYQSGSDVISFSVAASAPAGGAGGNAAVAGSSGAGSAGVAASTSPMPATAAATGTHTHHNNSHQSSNTSSATTGGSHAGVGGGAIPSVLSDTDLAASAAAASAVAASNSNGPTVIQATANCLYALWPYCSKSQRSQLRILLSDTKAVTVKYRPYNFKCRYLKKMTAFRSSQPLSMATANAASADEHH